MLDFEQFLFEKSKINKLIDSDELPIRFEKYPSSGYELSFDNVKSIWTSDVKSSIYKDASIIHKLSKPGWHIKDVLKVMGWVDYYTSAQNRQIPKEVWPMLREFTVVEPLLPKYVYRGVQIDSKKLMQLKPEQISEYIKSWENKSLLKAQGIDRESSWSLSEGTALPFSGMQYAAYSKTGIRMMLRWKVDPKYVIADLRNAPALIGNDFWNQNEIIVSPDAPNIEIIKLFDANKGYDIQEIKDYIASIKFAQFSGTGYDKLTTMLHYLLKKNAFLDVTSKLELKQYMNMTFKEVKDELRDSLYGDYDVDNCLFPLAAFVLAMFENFSLNIKIYKVHRNYNKSHKDSFMCAFEHEDYETFTFDLIIHQKSISGFNCKFQIELLPYKKSDKRFAYMTIEDFRGFRTESGKRIQEWFESSGFKQIDLAIISK